MSSKKTRIIIDTDIGDDADDALALAFAARSPEVEIVGVTTVFCNTVARAKIAKQLLNLLGKGDIPVYAGMGKPLINEADTVTLPKQFMKDMEDIPIPQTSALDFLYTHFMASGGTDVLVPIGPLTNIALLIQLYPEVKQKIGSIVLMGGSFYRHYNEWNIFCDPEAASIVFASGIPIKAIGLDVTLQTPVTEELFQEIRLHNTPMTDLLGELLNRFHSVHTHHTFLHDPMAVLAVFDEELLTYHSEDIVVELKGEFTRGTTFARTAIGKRSAEKGILCAQTIKSDAFVELFRKRILGL